MSVWRGAIALSIFCAMAVQFESHVRSGASIANFFSFFTIIANAIGAFAFVYAARSRRPSLACDRLRGAATLYLLIVGVLYALLLTGVESSMIPWVNVVLHVVSPIAVVVDWILDPPINRLSSKDGVAWLAVPALYLAYTFLRGAGGGWYPYPFLDPRPIGTPSVIAYCSGMCVFAALVAQAVIGVGNALRTRRAESASAATRA